MYSVFYYSKKISNSAKDVAIFALACLLIGHLLLREYMPSQVFGAIGAGLLLPLFFYVLCHKRDFFGFTLIIFICSHFTYAENQGGLWNLIAFGMLVLYYITGKPIKRIGSPDLLYSALIWVLLLSNLSGWILRNEMTGSSFAFGMISFLGIVLTSVLLGRVIITPDRLRVLVSILGLLVIYMFIVALNQRFAFVYLNSPLFGMYSAEVSDLVLRGTGRASGTLQHTELFGEYSMLLFALVIPFVVSKMTQRHVRLNRLFLFATFVFCLFNVFLSGTRSAFLLLIAASTLYLIIFLFYPLAVIDARKRYLKYILGALLSLSAVGSYVGFETTLNRFELLSDNASFRAEDVISGKGINRAPLFVMGLQRIESDNWIVGYGSGIPLSNYLALFNGRRSFYSDFHNLYLALPIIYGWAGAFAFVLLLLVTIVQLLKIIFMHRKKRHYLMPLVLGLLIFWMFFMMDQYKISILRIMNYQMLTWFFLGLSQAVIRTFYYYKPSKQTTNVNLSRAKNVAS